MAKTEAQRAHRRQKNAEYQAAFRARKAAIGLVQTPAYVSLDSRPEMWKLQRAFYCEPHLVFDPALGCLRNWSTGRFTSPVRVLERHDKT